MTQPRSTKRISPTATSSIRPTRCRISTSALRSAAELAVGDVPEVAGVEPSVTEDARGEIGQPEVAAAPEGEQIASSTTGSLPVYSLYGETQRPTAAMLAGVDVLVCDIQDIGVRYYTFGWSLTHFLEAAGERGVQVLVLDRPNPLGGVVVAGAPLDPALASMVGRWPEGNCGSALRLRSMPVWLRGQGGRWR